MRDNSPEKTRIGADFFRWVLLPLFFVICIMLYALSAGGAHTPSSLFNRALSNVHYTVTGGISLIFKSWNASLPLSSPNQPPPSYTPSSLKKDGGGFTHILLAGIPGKGNSAPYLTDTMILASIIPDKNSIVLISLPRDLWIKIPNRNFYGKLNSVYQYGRKTSEEQGMELLSRAFSEITGISPHYYARIDLAGIQEIVDTIGGFTVDNKTDIYDLTYPGPNNSYQLFSLEKGVHYLDGQTTLKYIRSRHTARGDFSRIERQQQVLRAIREKILSLSPSADFSELFSLYESMRENAITNIEIGEGKHLWDIVSTTPDNRIFTTLLSADMNTGLLRYARIDFGNGNYASALRPRAGQYDYSEIRSAVADLLMNPREISL